MYLALQMFALDTQALCVQLGLVSGTALLLSLQEVKGGGWLWGDFRSCRVIYWLPVFFGIRLWNFNEILEPNEWSRSSGSCYIFLPLSAPTLAVTTYETFYATGADINLFENCLVTVFCDGGCWSLLQYMVYSTMHDISTFSWSIVSVLKTYKQHEISNAFFRIYN